MKLYVEAATASNISVVEHKVTFDPDASWLKFHLGISRYALYSRDDPALPRLLSDMRSMMVVSAGEDLTCRRVRQKQTPSGYSSIPTPALYPLELFNICSCRNTNSVNSRGKVQRQFSDCSGK